MDNEQLIQEFKTITNSEDDENIKNLLTIHDWNLNNAIMTFFDTGFESVNQPQSIINHRHDTNDHDTGFGDNPLEDIESTARSSGSDPFTYSTAQSFEMQDLIPRLPFAPRISNNWQYQIGIYNSLKPVETKVNTIWFLLLFVPKNLLNLIYSILRYFFKPKPNSFPKAINYELMDLNHEINFDNYNVYHKNYNDVYQKTKDNNEWLLVVLVNNDTSRFVESLLENNHFVNHFGEKGVVKLNIYVGNVDKSPESWEIGSKYQCKRLPSVYLIGNVTNNPSIMPSMSIIYRSNISIGFISNDVINQTTNKITKNLKKLTDHYEPQLITARLEKREIELSRKIKQNQDEAYIRSLEADKVKKLEKQKQLDLENYQKDKIKYLQYLKNSNWWEDLNTNGTIRIQIKLPEEKIVVKLDPSICLKDLYLFIETKLSDDIDIDEDCSGFKHNNDFKFELIQPYPKKVFDELHSPIEEVLKSGMSLLVELDEDED